MGSHSDKQEVNKGSLLETYYPEQHFEKQTQNEALEHTSSRDPQSDHPAKVHSLFSTLKFYLTFPSVIWRELITNPRFRSKNELFLSPNEMSVLRGRQVVIPTLHIFACIGFYHILMGYVKAYTLLFSFILGSLASIGVTAGSHRLWSHRSYKAKWQFRLLLGILQTVGCNLSILNWATDHRIHHKYVDTDADPHNSRRGFMFCHILWLVTPPHPAYLEKKKLVYRADLLNDWVVKYQSKYYWSLIHLFTFLIPSVIPWYFWGENFWTAYFVCWFRVTFFLHGTLMINSVAHMFGTKPYDKDICPTETMIVSVSSFGDGWHNYHHVFPWDYRNAELWNYKLNLSAAFVDLFSLIGWTYDLKTVSAAMVERKVKRSGDGTHPVYGTKSENVWGWDDKDIAKEDKDLAVITNKKKE